MLVSQQGWKIYGLCERFWFKVCFAFQELSIRSQIKRSRHSPQETLTISELFSFLQAWTCPIASLLVTRTNGLSQTVYASCFLFPTLFEKRVTDHMWGTTQVPVSSPVNVPFMSRHRCGSPLKSARLMWSLGKKTQRTGSVYALGAKVYKFRKPALADDMGRLLSCRLSSHSASGKSQHNIAHNYTRYRWTPNISAFSADSISAALIWSKCLS